MSTGRLGHEGVSLIEFLVAVVILSIVSATLFTLFAAGTQSFSYGTKTADLQTGEAGALNVVLDDLSVAGYLRTGPSFAFTSVTLAAGTTSASITFEGDVNSDGNLDQLTYYVAGGELRRMIDLGTASGTFTSGGAPSTGMSGSCRIVAGHVRALQCPVESIVWTTHQRTATVSRVATRSRPRATTAGENGASTSLGESPASCTEVSSALSTCGAAGTDAPSHGLDGGSASST